MRPSERRDRAKKWCGRLALAVIVGALAACASPPPWVTAGSDGSGRVTTETPPAGLPAAGPIVRVEPGIRGTPASDSAHQSAPLPGDSRAAESGAAAPAAPALPRGPIPGKKNHPDEFVRPTSGGCACSGTLDMSGCKCLHCGQEAGAVCYCDQGPPRCLCGLDMPGCRCVHCAGRDGEGRCPCDHSKKARELEERSRR